MSEYYNGGITLKIGEYELKKISSFSTDWEIDEETFTDWKFEQQSIYRGRRFKASVTSGALTEDEKNQLMSALFARQFDFAISKNDEKSKEFEGAVRLTAAPHTEFIQNNIYGELYKVSFAVAAVALTGGDGSL